MGDLSASIQVAEDLPHLYIRIVVSPPQLSVICSKPGGDYNAMSFNGQGSELHKCNSQVFFVAK